MGAYAFSECNHLRNVQLNEGLTDLGGKQRVNEKETEGMVFAKSALESINLPSTLKTINGCTFWQCKNLKKVQFSEGLEKIGTCAFFDSGIREIALPLSTREIGAAAFQGCKQLQRAELNEGLQVLGAEGCIFKITREG